MIADPKRTLGRLRDVDESILQRRDMRAVVALALPLTIFVLLAAAVTFHVAVGWDTSVLRFAERHYDAPLVGPLGRFLRVTLVLGVAVAVSLTAAALVRHRGDRALFWALLPAGVLALDLLLKELFRRPELGGPEGYSFPSGNALGSAAFATAVFLVSSPGVRRLVVVIAVPLVVAYGAALVYAWWHYPTDVLAGWSLGVVWTGALWLALCRRVRGDASKATRPRARG